MQTDVKSNPVIEREKLLAARGWEAERERTGVLRELLERSVQRVYLWSFAQLRSRDRALELTRNTLLWASRTLGQVPDGRLLDHWIFEHLATETPARLDLLRSELGPEPCQVLGDDANEHYLDAYPACRKLRAAHQSYLEMPADGALVKRAGWAMVTPDLERFLEGHFGEENAQASEVKDPLPHRLGRLGFRQVVPVLLVIGLLGYVFWLRKENADLRAALEVQTTRPVAARPAAPDVDPAPANLRNVSLDVSDEFLTFTWDGISRAESYRLIFLTAKMDTLLVKPNIRTARTMVRHMELPDFDPAGSYVFKVDGFRNDLIIATSGMTAYPPM